jgi:hypothetical protein
MPIDGEQRLKSVGLGGDGDEAGAICGRPTDAAMLPPRNAEAPLYSSPPFPLETEVRLAIMAEQGGIVAISFSILAAAAVAAAPTHAGNDEVQRGPVPDWVVESEPMPVPAQASGLVFVRRQDTLVHFDRKGQAQYIGYRIKILHPNALELGNVSIAWNPAAGAPTVHALRIHRDGKAIEVLEKASFEILRREGQLEAARLDGILTAVLRVGDLRVGDELELSLTTRASDPTLGHNDSGLLLLAPEPPPGRFRLGLSWDEGQQPKLKMDRAMERVAQRRERAISFAFDNPPLLPLPKDVPARYRWQRVVEYSDFPDWPAVSRHFAPLFAKAAKLEAGSPLRDEARRIAAAHSDPLARAGAALKLVQQEVRYIYVGLGSGNLTPATAEETWQRRYGDCKGKTALLLALLTELGIEAEAVLANNSGADDGLDERLPSPSLFDHVLVRARINGSHYWLDGTLPPVAPPSASPVLPYRWTLPLSANGKSLEHFGWKPAKKPDVITLYDIDATAGFDKPARIVHTTIVRGIKGLQQQVQFSGLTSSQMLNAFRQESVGNSWQTIDDVRWSYNVNAQASVLTVEGTGPIDWNDDGDGAKSLSLPGGGFSPPERRSRDGGQDRNLPHFRAPEFDCYATTVRLPKATEVAHWSFNSSYNTTLFGERYYRTFELRGGAVRMIRANRTEQMEFDAATAERDNGRVSAFDNSMAWVSYDPTGEQSSPRGGKPVPATDEIDWTADDVPCLPPA